VRVFNIYFSMPFFFSLFSVFFRICVFLIQLLRFILSLSLSLRIRIRSSAEIETLLFCLRLNFCEERGEAEAEAGNWNEKENENEGQARDMCRYKDTRRLCVATGFPAGPRILGTKDSDSDAVGSPLISPSLQCVLQNGCHLRSLGFRSVQTSRQHMFKYLLLGIPSFFAPGGKEIRIRRV